MFNRGEVVEAMYISILDREGSRSTIIYMEPLLSAGTSTLTPALELIRDVKVSVIEWLTRVCVVCLAEGKVPVIGRDQ